MNQTALALDPNNQRAKTYWLRLCRSEQFVRKGIIIFLGLTATPILPPIPVSVETPQPTLDEIVGTAGSFINRVTPQPAAKIRCVEAHFLNSLFGFVMKRGKNIIALSDAACSLKSWRPT